MSSRVKLMFQLLNENTSKESSAIDQKTVYRSGTKSGLTRNECCKENEHIVLNREYNKENESGISFFDAESEKKDIVGKEGSDRKESYEMNSNEKCQIWLEKNDRMGQTESTLLSEKNNAVPQEYINTTRNLTRDECDMEYVEPVDTEPNEINEDNLLFDPDDDDDSHKDPDYEPNLSDSESEKEIKVLSQSIKRKMPSDINIAEEGEIVAKPSENIHQEGYSNAKSQVLNNEDIESRQIPKRARTSSQQKYRNRLKHPMLEPGSFCSCKKRQCTTLFTMEERSTFHRQFWDLNRDAQKMWLLNAVQETQASRKVEGSRRNFSRIYSFPKQNEENAIKKIQVCQRYFLSTLGYKSTSVIDHLLKHSKNEHGIPTMFPKEDGRGKHSPKNKKNIDLIKTHIKSYDPKPSHYRREHAPKRLYLPPDLTIKAMHDDYNSNHPQKKISYELYRRVLDEMNIAFYQANADKCSTCIQLELELTEGNINQKQLHLEEVKLRRTLYQQDAEKENPETKIYSADLQKVFLLPRMPKVKDSFFTTRLIAFNETFANMGKLKKSPHYCILWHEGIAGRRAEDVACSFIKFIQLQRDAESLIIWLDNCAGQNKNWILYSALIVYINSEFCTTKNITLRYLLTGHTYMAADGLHGKIEQYVKKVGNVEDFNDFTEACSKAASRNKVICLEISDFMKFENVCKSATIGSAKKRSVGDEVPLLKDIVEVKFMKGQQEFFYKTNFRETEYKKTTNLIKRKADLNLPKPLTTLRGVSTKKKDAIMKALVPAMKPSRKLFWENLHTNENAPDLLDEGY